MVLAFSIPLHDPVIIFAVVMLILLLVPLLMQKYKLPAVVGLIGAGLVLGPNMIGLLERDSTFELLGAVGLQYIMFGAGLEIDLAGFAKFRTKAAFYGVVTFLFPIALGTAAGVYLLGFATPSAVLLGSIFASHTLLAYPIASRLGLAKHEAVTVTIGATMVTDVLALVVLAVIAKMTQGELGLMFWLQVLVVWPLFAALIVVGLPKLARWFFLNRDGDGVEAFLFVIAAVFTSAWAAETAGLESIIGSFLAGFALNRLIPHTGPLSNRLHFVGEALFIPFFLVSVGMLANLWVLLDGVWSWAVSITMCVCVLSTKWAAAHLAGLILRYPKDDRDLMFGLSVPQAAATLAAVMVGHRLELFDDGVLNGTIIMILVTCVVGPMVTERSGRTVARRIAEAPTTDNDTPQRILVPLVPTDNAPLLMDMALLVRDALSDQPIYPTVIVPEGKDSDHRLASAEKLLSSAVRHAASAHVPTRPVTRVHNQPALGIASAARDTRTSHVIAGWDGRTSSSASLFGRVLDPMVLDGDSALMICYQRQPIATLQRVLVAIPPFAHRHPGFANQMRDIKTMVQRLAAPMVLLVPQETSSDVMAQVKAIRPSVPTTVMTYSGLGALMSALAEHVVDDDLLVLTSARPGTIGYHKSLDTIPRELPRRFTELDFVISYPLELSALDVQDVPRAPDAVITVDALNYEVALKELAGKTPDLTDEERQRLATALVARAKAGGVQVAPGVMVIDVHGPAVAVTRTVYGFSAEGMTFPKASGDINAVIALLSVEDRPLAAHLGELSAAAAELHDAEARQALFKRAPGGGLPAKPGDEPAAAADDRAVIADDDALVEGG